MVEIEFDFNHIKTMIQVNFKDTFQSVIDKYIQKTGHNHESLIYFVNGNKIEPEKIVENIMNDSDKEAKKMNVLVHSKNEGKKEIFEQSKDIICTKCNEPCKIKIYGHS